MRHISGIVVLLISLLATTRPAFACSGPEPTVQFFAEQAEIVVVGTLVESDKDVAVLEVEEVLKGDSDAGKLTINNHSLPNDDSCTMSLGDGGRFADGLRVLAFLQPDEFESGAEWRPVGIGGFAIFELDGDILRHVRSDAEFGSFQQAREELHLLTSGENAARDDVSGFPIVEGKAPPLVDPPIQAQPGGVVVEVMPLPVEARPNRAAAEVAPAAPLPLPQIALAVLLALSAALLIWALIQIARRRPLH